MDAMDATDDHAVKLVVMLETERGREAFLAMARAVLPEGERIVRVEELRGERALVLMLPRDAGAQLVAREPPAVLPGGFTLLVSYLRVRDASALQVRVGEGGVREERELTMAA